MLGFWLRYRDKTQRMEPSIAPVLIKFLNNEANRKELLLLEQWITEEGSSKLLSDYMKVNGAAHTLFDQYDGEHAKEVLRRHIEKESKDTRHWFASAYFKYAAILVLALGLGYMLFQQSGQGAEVVTEPVIVNNEIKTGTDKATLTLGDGSLVELTKDAPYQGANASSNGAQLFYGADAVETISYHTLTVPRGGQFVLEMADGTKVWLNSGSQLQYPTSFRAGTDRTVQLVYGEAYFDVSPASEHQGAKFFVEQDRQVIEVLGTEFNVKAYPEESQVLTTLVEGRVALGVGSEPEVSLVPGQQATWDTRDGAVTLASVDVYDEVSWKDGVFSFDRMPLEDIMTVLSRWYDMEVVFENDALREEGFTGALGKEQEIEDILTTIKNFGIIENFEINTKTITLK